MGAGGSVITGPHQGKEMGRRQSAGCGDRKGQELGVWASTGAGRGREQILPWSPSRTSPARPRPDRSRWKQDSEITSLVAGSHQVCGGWSPQRQEAPTSVSRTPMRGWSAERPALGEQQAAPSMSAYKCPSAGLGPAYSLVGSASKHMGKQARQVQMGWEERPWGWAN